MPASLCQTKTEVLIFWIKQHLLKVGHIHLDVWLHFKNKSGETRSILPSGQTVGVSLDFAPPR